MSYDLYLYKKKESNITQQSIFDYLNNNVQGDQENPNLWFYENEDTDVYFYFELSEPDEESEDNESDYSFKDFENTQISFNLNFMRPSFFGLEAFEFIEKFTTDLDLYILNPQSNIEIPSKFSKEALFDEWNETNLRSSITYFKEFEASYMLQEKATNAWQFNINRNKLQGQVGDNYFVPRLFFFKYKNKSEVFTVATWPYHIPVVLPPADYYLLVREYKKFFRTIKENVFISKEKLFSALGSYFEDFDFEDCRIIHEPNAIKIKSKFNSLKALKMSDIVDRVAIDKLYNARPE